MTEEDPVLGHSALLHGSDDEYVERCVPFLREGLEAGHGGTGRPARSLETFLGEAAAALRSVG